MGHAAIDKFRSESHKAKALVKTELVRLRREVEAVPARCPCMCHGRRYHRLGNATPTACGAHCNPTDLDVLVEEDEAERAHDLTVRHSYEVGGRQVIGVV